MHQTDRQTVVVVIMVGRVAVTDSVVVMVEEVAVFIFFNVQPLATVGPTPFLVQANIYIGAILFGSLCPSDHITRVRVDRASSGQHVSSLIRPLGDG